MHIKPLAYDIFGKLDEFQKHQEHFKKRFVSLCPITNTRRGFGCEVDIPEDGITIQKNEPFYLMGVILTHQFKNLDARSRRLKVAGTMPDEIIEYCMGYVSTYLS